MKHGDFPVRYVNVYQRVVDKNQVQTTLPVISMDQWNKPNWRFFGTADLDRKVRIIWICQYCIPPKYQKKQRCFI